MYTKNHKLLLQALIHEGALLDIKLKEVSFKIFPHVETSRVIEEINEKLDEIDMMIKSSICEITEEKYWSVISFVTPNLDKHYFPYQPHQLKFLNKIFANIITVGVGCISSVECLNSVLTPALRMSKMEAESFINQLAKKQWLSIKEGWIFIGPRSTAELTQYFKQNYSNFISYCYLCKEIIFYGKHCPKCNKKCHYRCIRNYSTAKKGAKKCPSCNYQYNSIDDSISEHLDQFCTQVGMNNSSEAQGTNVDESIQSQRVTRRKRKVLKSE